MEAQDEWAAAIDIAGSKQKRVESLAHALTPWIEQYKDRYDRQWWELSNPAHSSSTFWEDICHEATRRGVEIPKDVFKHAIKEAFSWLHAADVRKVDQACEEYMQDPSTAVAWKDLRKELLGDTNQGTSEDSQ